MKSYIQTNIYDNDPYDSIKTSLTQTWTIEQCWSSLPAETTLNLAPVLRIIPIMIMTKYRQGGQFTLIPNDYSPKFTYLSMFILNLIVELSTLLAWPWWRHFFPRLNLIHCLSCFKLYLSSLNQKYQNKMIN